MRYGTLLVKELKQLNRIAADRTLGPTGPVEERGFWGRLMDIFKGDW